MHGSATGAQPITISVAADCHVSALLERPAGAHALLVLAHGAGAGMQHPFLTTLAEQLAAVGIATLRYQFPYMQKGSRRPDPPALCHATVRAAVASAHERAPELALFAGGKSFGGRMTSQAQAAEALPGVRGLVFLGFPLHPPDKPSDTRAEHLSKIKIPMLFLQGSRDEFAELTLLEPVIARLEARATLTLLADADHSFHVPARSGRRDPEVRREMLAALAAWIQQL